jgi:helix-turn-helix protein
MCRALQAMRHGGSCYDSRRVGDGTGNLKYMKTLNLREAAVFLHMHPEEVRTRAKRGIIPGAKIGRCWVFIDTDLADFIRSQYPVRRQALPVWGSLRQDVAMDRRAASIEIREADRSRASRPPSSSEHRDVRTAGPDEENWSRPTQKEYEELLKPTPRRGRKSPATKSKANPEDQ